MKQDRSRFWWTIDRLRASVPDDELNFLLNPQLHDADPKQEERQHDNPPSTAQRLAALGG